MWAVVRYIIECVEDDKQVKANRALEQGKKIDDVDEKGENDEDEDEGFATFVLLKDFTKMSIKMYKKDDADEDEDDDNE